MNYLDLINIKYSFKKHIFIFFILVFILIIYVLNLNMCENYSTYAYIENGFIVTKIGIENPDIINNMQYLKIGSNKYQANIYEVSEPALDNDNFINYSIVKLKLSDRLYNNEVFKLDIFYNQEKVYKKLKKILF